MSGDTAVNVWIRVRCIANCARISKAVALLIRIQFVVAFYQFRVVSNRTEVALANAERERIMEQKSVEKSLVSVLGS